MGVDLIFETHSISEDNERGIATGWLPGALSTRGRQLAQERGARHRLHPPAVVFTSDLQRAIDTAELAFRGTNIQIRADARLRECNYGQLNGAPVAQLEGRRAEHLQEPYPGGESFDDVVARMASFLGGLAREWDGDRVVVIGHSATRWALDHLLHGLPLVDLVDEPFNWQEGWRYVVPSDFAASPTDRTQARPHDWTKRPRHARRSAPPNLLAAVSLQPESMETRNRAEMSAPRRCR
jgi:alpha-ribazole phosphatase/probable phosphoglycerate mutase